MNYLAGVPFSCVSRVTPCQAIGVWTGTKSSTSDSSLFSYAYYIIFILSCKESAYSVVIGSILFY